MTQVRKERQTQKAQDVQQDTDIPGAEARASAAKVSADTADVLADIDELLNELPQDLATSFVQRGGE